jgi:uncharacterized surface anchored protein
VTNRIEFVGIIGPDPDVTLANVNDAENRLVITYRVQVPADVAVVPNTATLTVDGGDTFTATETYTRTITPPPTTGGGGSGTVLTQTQIQETVKALPATGETTWWSDALRGLLLALIPIGGVGALWIIRRRARNEA